MNQIPLGRLGLPLLAWALVLSSLATGPVQAAKVTRSDGVNEPAQLDIRRLQVDNGKTRLVVKLKMRKLTPKKTSAYAIFGPPKSRFKYAAGLTKTKKGQASRPLFLRGFKTPVKCRGDRIRIDRGKKMIVISIPQRCLGKDAGKLTVSALSEKPNFDDVDFLRPRTVKRG